jgi:FkbM family methyltransferase
MLRVVPCQVGAETILLEVDDAPREGDKRNHVAWRADSYATREPDTIAWVKQQVRPGDVMYDIGANIGQYGLYAAVRLKGRCRVLAFEPEALNYAALNRHIVLNGMVECMTAYCLAVSDTLEASFFYVQDFATGAALHNFGSPETQGEQPFTPGNRQGMLSVPLDDLTGRFGLPFPNHIKVDVDGGELRIVNGARRTLADPRLRSVLIEVFMHKEIAQEIIAAFTTAGFRLSNADTVRYDPGIVQNLIFVR